MLDSYENKVNLLSVSFGSHMALRYQIERQMISQEGRMPGLKSSNLGLELLENRLSKLDPEDYMRRTMLSPSR